MIDWIKSLPVSGTEVRANAPASLSDEWFQARRGRITASTRAQIIEEADPKAWRKLSEELLAEMSPDWRYKHVDNIAMAWGREHEAEALRAIGAEFGCRILEPGLILHPEYDHAGSTPDGYLYKDTTIQVKCPFSSKNHMKTILDQQMSAQYYAQVQWEGWTTGRKKIIYASFDPRVPKDMRLFMISVPWDEDMWKTFEVNLALFKERFESQKFLTPGKLSVYDGIPELFT